MGLARLVSYYAWWHGRTVIIDNYYFIMPITRQDAIRSYRPQIVEPIEYKSKANEQVLKFTGRKPIIVKRTTTQVTQNNKSNYQNEVAEKNMTIQRQKHQQQRNYEAAAQGVEAVTKLVSPSTYVGAAARSLTNDGNFGDNLASGKGFNSTAANIAFDVTSPFILKSSVSTLGKVTNHTFNKLHNYVLLR